MVLKVQFFLSLFISDHFIYCNYCLFSLFLQSLLFIILSCYLTLLEGKVAVEIRDHPCFCAECSHRNYEDCSQKETVGQWNATTMTLKVIPKVYDTVPENVKNITKFYYGTILQSEQTSIVGMVMIDKSDGTKHLKFGTLSTPPKINKKEAISKDMKINKQNFTVAVPKNSAFIRVKLLIQHSTLRNCYYLQQNTRETSVHVLDLIGPSNAMYDDTSINRQTFVKYTKTENILQNNFTQIVYEIEDSCMVWFDSQL